MKPPPLVMSAAMLAALLVALPLIGCGGGGAITVAAPIAEPEQFVAGVSHAYLPLAPGRVWNYLGEEDGLPLREVVRTVDHPRLILATTCTGLEVQVFVDDVLVEVTTEWFAQDKDGNVWKFGEESWGFDGAKLVTTSDSWQALPGGPQPWIVFAADPAVGDRYTGYGANAGDVLEVLSVTELVTVPAGTFAPCLEIHENATDAVDKDIILYAPGVGRVSETNAGGWLHLESMN